MNDYVTITGGDCAILTGGDYSILTGGDYSTLTGGDHAILIGGVRSSLTGGDGSILAWDWWDYRANCMRRTVTHVGEDGIEPNVAYRCIDGKVMRAEGAE